MESKDLMIGDWIRNDFGELQQIVEIRNDGVMLAYNDIYPYDKIEPIPITPEILEKNGMSQWTGGGDSTKMLCTPYGYEGTRYSIYIGLQKKTIEIHCAPPIEGTPGWRKHNKVYLEVCGHYVHELQHALRLCGIDKEIEL